MLDRVLFVLLGCTVKLVLTETCRSVVPQVTPAQEWDQSSLIQTLLATSRESDESPASALMALPSIYQPVRKTPTNDFARFVFFAGLGGTGHHGWHQTMGKSEACTTHPGAESRMRKLWYGDDDSVDLFYDELVAELHNTTQHHIQSGTKQLYCLNILEGSMLSYPDCNSKRHHPDLVSLTRAAADAGADLRIVVLHRDPAPMLVSLSLHRTLLPLAEEANQMINQAAILHAQLSAIDSQLFVCVPFTGVVNRADEISKFVVGGLKQSFAPAIRKHYIPHQDDVEEARKKIMKHGNHMLSKMKTWEAFHGLLLKGCWQRTPKVTAY